MFLTSAELWCWHRGSLACSLQLFKIQHVQFIDPVSFEHILEALFGILKLPDLLSMSFYTVHGSELNAVDKTRHMARLRPWAEYQKETELRGLPNLPLSPKTLEPRDQTYTIFI